MWLPSAFSPDMQQVDVDVIQVGIPATSFLGSFRDLDEPFLSELRHPRHGIRVDLDSGKYVFVSPVVNLRRRAAQLKVHTAFHQVRDEVFVRIAGCHIPFGAVPTRRRSAWAPSK